MASLKQRVDKLWSDKGESKPAYVKFPPEEVKFYYEDGNFEAVTVNEGMTAATIFKILTKKKKAPEDGDWAIIETLDSICLERSLEDHEFVLPLWKKLTQASPLEDYVKFSFGRDVLKRYDYMKNPGDYFPLDMVSPADEEGNCLTTSSKDEKRLAMEKMLTKTRNSPVVFGYMFAKIFVTDTWTMKYFVLMNSFLYCCEIAPTTNETDTSQMTEIANMRDFNIYRIEIKSKRKPLWKYCFCIKTNPFVEKSEKSLRFACQQSETRFAWITAMRLQKYGHTLHDNYKSYKLLKDNNPVGDSEEKVAEAGQSTASGESLGAEGGVQSMTEAMQSLELTVPRCPPICGGLLKGLGHGIHLSQPWYNTTFTSKEVKDALAASTSFPLIGGGFVVVESPAGQDDKYVLHYSTSSSIESCAIVTVDENGDPQTDENKPMYFKLAMESYGENVPKLPIFYDLVQLVEYYTLNWSTLRRRLSRYVGPAYAVPTKDTDTDTDSDSDSDF